jgi:hypothetical protein
MSDVDGSGWLRNADKTYPIIMTEETAVTVGATVQ